MMLLLMLQVEHFFYELPNVSGTDQITKPSKPGPQTASWWVSEEKCIQLVPGGLPQPLSLSPPSFKM